MTKSKLTEVRRDVVAKVTAANRDQDRGAFESETLYRLIVEAARYWCIETVLRAKKLPGKEVYFVYPRGPSSLNWGDDTFAADADRPLAERRIRVTIEIENV